MEAAGGIGSGPSLATPPWAVRIRRADGKIAGSGILHSPVKDVFQRCIPMDPHDRNGRMSWDETAVLVAVRGPSGYFNVVKGRMVCHPDGSNGWDPNGDRDAYLTFRASPEELAAVINGLMMHQRQ